MLRSFRTQLFLWTILPLALVLIGAAVIGVNSHQASMRELVAERDGALALSAADWISQLLSDRQRDLSSLDPSRPDTWNMASLTEGVALFDSQGNLVRASPDRGSWQNRSLALPRTNAFSSPFQEGGAWKVLLVRRLDSGATAGPTRDPEGSILATVVTLPELARMTPRGVAYLLDSQGRIIADPNPARVGTDMQAHNGVAQVMQGQAGATFHRDSNQKELVVGYAPVLPARWGLLVEEPWEDVVAPMFQYAVLLPFMLVMVSIVALAAIYFGVRNIVRPLQDLAQVANRIAFGDYAAANRPVGGIREVEELRETLRGMAQQVQAAQEAMQRYVVAITRSQEDERKRLARELHDDTIQSLIALRQRAELADRALSHDPALARHRLEELEHVLTDTLDGVRRFVRDLRPTYLDELGLIPALEMLARESNAQFTVEGDERRVDPERELVLYRIVQEALRNVKKHAGATQVSIQLAFDSDEVRATVQDNGVGFAAPESSAGFVQAGHFGLTGMQERAQLFGGNVYVKSQPGAGTTVVAYVPFRPESL